MSVSGEALPLTATARAPFTLRRWTEREDVFAWLMMVLPLLFLADGTYLEDQARAQHLGGDQWGMTNETGSYPGQSWLWLYTFWYQIEPFASSDNADAWVWGLMMVLTVGLMLLPFIPGLRSIPRWIPIHRLVWRDYYRRKL